VWVRIIPTFVGDECTEDQKRLNARAIRNNKLVQEAEHFSSYLPDFVESSSLEFIPLGASGSAYFKVLRNQGGDGSFKQFFGWHYGSPNTAGNMRTVGDSNALRALETQNARSRMRQESAHL
jgi:hypothetical protein